MKKSTTPCCKAPYKHIFGIHLKWMHEIYQWECSICKTEYNEIEIFEHAEKEFKNE